MKFIIFNFWVLRLLSSLEGLSADNPLLTVNTTITYTLISVLPSSYHPEGTKLSPSNHSLSRTLSYATTKVGFLPRTSKALITTRSITRYSTIIITVSPVPFAQPKPSSLSLKPRSPSLLWPALCNPGTIFCNSLTKFFVCATRTWFGSRNSIFILVGSVAAGTVCQNNKIVRTTDGNCTPIGNLACKSNGQTFFICMEGGVISMGQLSTYLLCVNGKFVALAENAKFIG